MSREADYDIELFVEMTRSGQRPSHGPERNVRGLRSRAPRAAAEEPKVTSPPKPRKRATR